MKLLQREQGDSKGDPVEEDVEKFVDEIRSGVTKGSAVSVRDTGQTTYRLSALLYT